MCHRDISFALIILLHKKLSCPFLSVGKLSSVEISLYIKIRFISCSLREVFELKEWAARSPCRILLEQVWHELLTTCDKLDGTIDLLQGCSNKTDTVMVQQYCSVLVLSTL